MLERELSGIDTFIINVDQCVRTLFRGPHESRRAYPAEGLEDHLQSDAERRHSEALMRVNHAGEISAQALYQGQGMTARDPVARETMQCSAHEENDHLVWCEQRLYELGGHTSYLNPLWYLGSFCIGSLAGCVGDKWSLGFVAETERQVVRHLDGHLASLPHSDIKSRAIVEQMKEDEAHHATVAIESGAVPLPQPVKRLMSLAAKVMTQTAYWL
ncbi:MAG: 2-polyprenyl-3-methyl-6-methoxy-1,4-benzoquinone monooxygenase [Gammaproteobacteria bacterium]|nr:2-polyprenyl-3-methyl-6-methoxy-1,4-benzoquinone monooxygenase [Gammaproteobacteria bacterium]